MQMSPFKVKGHLLLHTLPPNIYLWFSQNYTCSLGSLLFTWKEIFRSVKNCEGEQTVENLDLFTSLLVSP